MCGRGRRAPESHDKGRDGKRAHERGLYQMTKQLSDSGSWRACKLALTQHCIACALMLQLLGRHTRLTSCEYCTLMC